MSSRSEGKRGETLGELRGGRGRSGGRRRGGGGRRGRAVGRRVE